MRFTASILTAALLLVTTSVASAQSVATDVPTQPNAPLVLRSRRVPRRGALIAGATLLTIGYGSSVALAVALQSGCSCNAEASVPLLVPVVGPFVVAALSVSSHSDDPVLLFGGIMLGAVQLAGAAAGIRGIVGQREVEPAHTTWQIVPLGYRSGAGIGVTVTTM